MDKTLLVVGAGGFIGGFIAKRGLELGYEVWVTVRETTSRKYLDDERLHFLVLDYDNEAMIADIFRENKPGEKGWIYVVYNLGATKAPDFPAFNRVNFQYLRAVGTALRSAGCQPLLFLYMSSLSVLGPGDEQNYTPYTGSFFPNPNTRYGLSKVKAEQWLELQSGLPWVIFRPTGVYGPHEQDYLMMIKSIDSHFDFGIGYKKQLLTFIYVEDIVQAIFDALGHRDNVLYKKYIISEDRAYTQKEFREIVAQALGKKWVIPVRLPLWLTWFASYISEKWGKMRMRTTTLNRDKFKIMKQRNWTADISDARRDFGFNPTHSLGQGIAATVASYREEKNKK